MFVGSVFVCGCVFCLSLCVCGDLWGREGVRRLESSPLSSLSSLSPLSSPLSAVLRLRGSNEMRPPHSLAPLTHTHTPQSTTNASRESYTHSRILSHPLPSTHQKRKERLDSTPTSLPPQKPKQKHGCERQRARGAGRHDGARLPRGAHPPREGRPGGLRHPAGREEAPVVRLLCRARRAARALGTSARAHRPLCTAPSRSPFPPLPASPPSSLTGRASS